MNSERWDQVKNIVNACVELGPDKRTAFLNHRCADDELRAEAESLLASLAEAGESFLEQPAFERASESLTGRRIGLYEVREKIAEGGMGAVYCAARLSDFEKR